MKIKYQDDFEFLIEEVGANTIKRNEKGIRKNENKKQKKLDAKAARQERQNQVQDEDDTVDKKTKI